MTDERSAHQLPDLDAIAAEALAALDARAQIRPFSERFPGLSLAEGYGAAALVQRVRARRGERPVGRKIGFTNAAIWAEYGVDGPIWGWMYDTTVRDAGGTPVELAPFLEPRIEPEIALRLARPPEAGMDEAALLECVDAVAHGFEIVQSIFPGWRFSAVDTVIGVGLHGAYVVGPWREIEAAARGPWLERLATFGIELVRDGAVVDRGCGANVLGGPLSALRHLVETLAMDGGEPLAAGEIVTTGTLTRAFPVAAGERWDTRISGMPVDGLDVTFR